MKTRLIAAIMLVMFVASNATHFAFAVPSLTLDPTSGSACTVVTVTGSGFGSGWYRVYFDTDGGATHDAGETYKYVLAGAAGTFTTTLTVPSVPSGLYYIRADVYPYTAPAIASAPFTVVTIWDKLVDIESEVLDIEDKLDDIVVPNLNSILTYLTGTIEPTLDGIKAKTDTINWGDITAIKTEIGDISVDSGRAAWTTLGKALDDIKDEIVTIDGVVDNIWGAVDTMEADLKSWMTTNLKTNIDNIWGKVDAEIDAIKAKTDTINWADITYIKGKADSIKTEVTAIETKLEGGGSFWTFVNDWFETIENKLDVWFDTAGTYSETTQVKARGGRVTSTTLVPAVALSTSGTGVTVEWSTDQAYGGSYSAKMTIQAGSGHDDNGGRIVIDVWDLNKKLTDIDPSTTLDGQLKHTFWAFQPTPFLTDFPYFRIRLDTDGDPSTFEVMLVAMGTHTLRPEQQLPADAPTGQWIQITEIGGGEIVGGEYVEGTQYWRPVPYEAFEYHVLQYWQQMYPEARIIDVAVICGFWGTPRTETVSIYVDDVTILGYTFNLEPEPTVSIAKAEASETAQFTVTLSADVTDVGDIAIVKATFDGTNWLTLEELTTDSYKTITIAARGVEILYYDASPYNMVIDWGITVVAKPGVTVTWTP